MKKQVYEEIKERITSLESERSAVYEAMQSTGFCEAMQRKVNILSVKIQIQKEIMERVKWRGVRDAGNRGYLPSGVKIHTNI